MDAPKAMRPHTLVRYLASFTDWQTLPIHSGRRDSIFLQALDGVWIAA
jgi:hypothetical protein